MDKLPLHQIVFCKLSNNLLLLLSERVTTFILLLDFDSIVLLHLKLKFVSKVRKESDLVYLIHLIGQAVIPSGENVFVGGYVL